MMGGGGEGQAAEVHIIFIPKKIPTSDFVYPQKIPTPTLNCAYVIVDLAELMKKTISKQKSLNLL